MGKLKTLSPIYYVKDDWEILIVDKDPPEYTWLTFYKCHAFR